MIERNDEIVKMVLKRLYNEHGIMDAKKEKNVLYNPDFAKETINQ